MGYDRIPNLILFDFLSKYNQINLEKKIWRVFKSDFPPIKILNNYEYSLSLFSTSLPFFNFVLPFAMVEH